MDKRSPSTGSSVKRSLNIPKPSTLAVPLVLDAYTQHPEVATLDQIMLHYLGIEEILKLYRQNYERFETLQTLGTLALRFNLPAATTFKQLLKSYDMHYATVRSYLYKNRSPKEILFQAAKEGDIQAMYNQLKLYPKLRKKHVYTSALYKAAVGGHRAIIDLLLELGADKHEILVGAAKGGHLSLVIEELAKVDKKGIIDSRLAEIARLAAANNQLEVLDYILSINASKRVLNFALGGAGTSANTATIEYLIAKGADGYTALVEGAIEGDHFELFKQYYGKVGPEESYYIFQTAIDNLRLDVVRYLFESGVVDEDELVEALGDLRRGYRNNVRQMDNPKKLSYKELGKLALKIDDTTHIIEYLEYHGVTNEESSEIEIEVTD